MCVLECVSVLCCLAGVWVFVVLLFLFPLRFRFSFSLCVSVVEGLCQRSEGLDDPVLSVCGRQSQRGRFARQVKKSSLVVAPLCFAFTG